MTWPTIIRVRRWLRTLHQNKSTRRTPAGVFVLVLRELLRSRTGRQYRSTSPMADAERVLHHSAPAVVDPALPHRMGGAGTFVGGHFHKLAVHLFHAGQLQYAVKSRHKNTTVQNLHALNTLGGDLPVSQAASFGVALFFRLQGTCHRSRPFPVPTFTKIFLK